ncbi:hypothetical protein NEOLEDRAFT_1127984 [Neolentinus lepideus HHB14362 ss-1]|uniref:Uncharacterized protein n=1 Tax=Neolentinus lepideus HHB14362 ss-1 TaxID=1314782 RepID=A0A165V7V6_9AGAM|nr:hypothetical protein NEOLEDRAFT_1127984 [Neolentinus lepideus HHB14362 ss-1]
MERAWGGQLICPCSASRHPFRDASEREIRAMSGLFHFGDPRCTDVRRCDVGCPVSIDTQDSGLAVRSKAPGLDAEDRREGKTSAVLEIPVRHYSQLRPCDRNHSA